MTIRAIIVKVNGEVTWHNAFLEGNLGVAFSVWDV